MRTRMSFAAITLLLWVPLVPAATVHGTVMSRTGRVAQALVFLNYNGVPVDRHYSDSNGAFEFTGVRKLDYDVVVQHEGFAVLHQAVDISHSSDEISITLYLEPEMKTKAGSGPAVSVRELNHPETDKLLKKASKLMESRRFSAAAEVLREAIERAPGDASLYQALGLALMESNQNDAAIATLKKAGELHAPRASLYLAMVYNHLRRDADAEAAARDAVTADPEDWRGWRELGEAEYHQQRLQEAQANLKKALDGGGNAHVHLDLANVYVAQRNFAPAAEHFRAYVAADPHTPEARRARQVLQEMHQAGVVK